MKEFLAYQRTILILIIVTTGAAVGSILITRPEHAAWAYGIAMGSAFGLIKFRLDVLAILRFAQTIDTDAAKPAIKNYFLGIALMGAALILAMAFKQHFNMWATAIGLIIPKAILIADGLLRPGYTPGPRVSEAGGNDEN